MGSTTHRIEITRHYGDDGEAEIVADYVVDWGRAATREDPEEPAQVHSIEVYTIDGQDRDWGTYWGDAHYRNEMADWLLNCAEDELLEHAAKEAFDHD